MTAAVDFRASIQDRLNAKQNQLGQTELNLKKYVGGNEHHFRYQRRKSVNDRLGPPTFSQQAPTSRLSGRLGPKVVPEEDEDDDGTSFVDPPVNKAVMSRVEKNPSGTGPNNVATREKVLEAQKSALQRNKRLFGDLLLGTLQRFRQDETRVKEREMKKREIELKIEAKTEQERKDAIRYKRELVLERRKQRREIRILQTQMKRVEEFEIWESAKRRQMQFIKTKTEPSIFYLPKEHNDKTLTALEETMDVIELEIKETKAKFEEDLLKIEAKIDNDDENDDDEDEEDEDEGIKEKPKSVINKVEPVSSISTAIIDTRSISREKERNSSPNGRAEEKIITKMVEEEEPEKGELKDLCPQEKSQIVSKNNKESAATFLVKNNSTSANDNKKEKRKRRSTSSSSSENSSSENSSSDSSEDEEEKKKKKQKKQKKKKKKSNNKKRRNPSSSSSSSSHSSSSSD